MSNYDRLMMNESIVSFRALIPQLLMITGNFENMNRHIYNMPMGHPDLSHMQTQLQRMYAEEEDMLFEMHKGMCSLYRFKDERLSRTQLKLRETFMRNIATGWKYHFMHYGDMIQQGLNPYQ